MTTVSNCATEMSKQRTNCAKFNFETGVAKFGPVSCKPLKREAALDLKFRRASQILPISMYQSLLILVFAVGGSLGALKGSDYKKVVEYEGNIFVLHSGCPEIQCQRLPQLDYCKKYRDDYEKCMG